MIPSLPQTGSFGPPVVAGHDRGQLDDIALNSRVCLAFEISSGEESDSMISGISVNKNNTNYCFELVFILSSPFGKMLMKN